MRLLIILLLCCGTSFATETPKRVKIPKSLIKKVGMSEEAIREAYERYLRMDHAPHPVNAATYATRITPNDPVIVALAAFLCKDVKPEKRQEKIIHFVQGIRYKEDPLRTIDYVKHPLETLCEKEGDCEDLSILAASLLLAAGFDAVIVMLPNRDPKELDHIVLGIISTEKGGKVRHRDKEYTLVETTDTLYDIGDTPRFWREYDFSQLNIGGPPRDNPLLKETSQ